MYIHLPLEYKIRSLARAGVINYTFIKELIDLSLIYTTYNDLKIMIRYFTTQEYENKMESVVLNVHCQQGKLQIA